MNRLISLFAILSVGAAALASDSEYVILLKSRQFIPEPGVSEEARLHLESMAPERAHIIIQFYNTLSIGERRAVENAGVNLCGYIPNSAFFASLTYSDLDQVMSLSIVRSIVEILPEDKISSDVQLIYDTIHLIVFFHCDVSFDDAEQLIADFYGTVDARAPMSNALGITIGRSKFDDLVNEDVVHWVSEIIYSEYCEVDCDCQAFVFHCHCSWRCFNKYATWNDCMRFCPPMDEPPPTCVCVDSNCQPLPGSYETDCAWPPGPANGQINVAADVVLSWGPGQHAAYHDVYLGTSWDDVNDANTSSRTYLGRLNLDVNAYDPRGLLQLDTAYYWRIDEVNEPNVWNCWTWQFTTANHIIVDDFESYDQASNEIWYTWVDGWENWSGSYIDLATDPCKPVHGGEASLVYFYDNTGYWGTAYYSEAERPYDPPQDWTSLGTKALTLYFYGDRDNDANETEQLYVGLGGSYAQVKYPDMNDVKKSEWTEWNIAMADFTGVDPCAVTSLFIGFGDRDNNIIAGGEGIVYFDDIRLYLPRCLADKARPVADFTNDCVVDYKDLSVLAEDWLEGGAYLYDQEPPAQWVVNFRDYAVFVGMWLEQELWPLE